MARSPQPLQRILAADPTLAGWDARRRREVALTGIVRRHLPRPLAERIRVADERGPELDLVADAGAIAAVARQRAPTPRRAKAGRLGIYWNPGARASCRGTRKDGENP